MAVALYIHYQRLHYSFDRRKWMDQDASDAAATARAMSIAMDALGTWMSSNGCHQIDSASTLSKLNLFGLAPASSWLS